MNQKISIIVPIYNAEKYLCECIDSILAQTYSDFELLLINDGSTDNSGSICNDYYQKDSRIKVFHKENGGVSSARNLGILKSKGEYICFIDSDDFAENTFLQDLLNTISIHKSDIVICKYYEYHESKQKKNIPSTKQVENSGTGIEILNEIIKNDLTYPLWVSIFKATIIKDNNIQFSENIYYGEDQQFIYKALYYCKSFFSLNKTLYNYRVFSGSALSKKTLRQFDYPLAMIDIFYFLKNKNVSDELISNFISKKIPKSIFFSINLIFNSSQIKINDVHEFLRKNKLYHYIFLNFPLKNIPKIPLYLYMFKVKTKYFIRKLVIK